MITPAWWNRRWQVKWKWASVAKELPLLERSVIVIQRKGPLAFRGGYRKVLTNENLAQEEVVYYFIIRDGWKEIFGARELSREIGPDWFLKGINSHKYSTRNCNNAGRESWWATKYLELGFSTFGAVQNRVLFWSWTSWTHRKNGKSQVKQKVRLMSLKFKLCGGKCCQFWDFQKFFVKLFYLVSYSTLLMHKQKSAL